MAGIPQSKLDEWRELAGAMERTGEQYADVVAALLDEVERLTRERDHNRDVITRAVSRLPVPYSLSELVAEWEEMRALLREEVLPFVEHAVKDYDCAKGIVLAERLAAFLK